MWRYQGRTVSKNEYRGFNTCTLDSDHTALDGHESIVFMYFDQPSALWKHSGTLGGIGEKFGRICISESQGIKEISTKK